MSKAFIKSSVIAVCMLFLVTACADEEQQTSSAEIPADPHTQSNASADLAQTIMDQPVDFSNPEAFQESMQKIGEQGGDESRKAVENALKYVMYYDLSLGGDEMKMYEKLDGKTPNQIIAMMKK